MTEAHIDSASIHGAIAALDYDRVQRWHLWAYQSIVTVTALLLCHPHLRIVPGISPRFGLVDRSTRAVEDLYDFGIRQLLPVLETTLDSYSDATRLSKSKENAERKTKEWIKNSTEEAKKAFFTAKTQDCYESWLEWAIQNAWERDSERINGLFNFEMIEELALTLDCDKQTMYRVWKITQNLERLRLWKQKQEGEDFKIACEAYVASAVFRGRYHDELAKSMKWQVTHHPIRDFALIQPTGTNNIAIPLTRPFTYFCNIIINGAMKESNSKSKIALWTENMKHAQGDQKIMTSLFEPEDDIDISRKKAINAAQALKLRLYPKWLDLMDIPLALAVTGLTSFVLTGWADLSLALPFAITRPVHRITEKTALREKNLQKLSTLPAGRITQEWDISV